MVKGSYSMSGISGVPTAKPHVLRGDLARPQRSQHYLPVSFLTSCLSKPSERAPLLTPAISQFPSDLPHRLFLVSIKRFHLFVPGAEQNAVWLSSFLGLLSFFSTVEIGFKKLIYMAISSTKRSKKKYSIASQELSPFVTLTAHHYSWAVIPRGPSPENAHTH